MRKSALFVIALALAGTFWFRAEIRSNSIQANQSVALDAASEKAARPPLPPSVLPLQFIKNERVAFVGGSLAERMNLFGHFETLLHTRFPELDLIVRNFGRPADEVAIRQRPNDYTKIDDPLEMFGADTFFCFFGFNESFAGPEGLEKFKADYEKFLDEYAAKYPRGMAAPRFVLISPTAFESTGDKFLPDGRTENINLKLYSSAVAEVARKRGLALVDLFTPTASLFIRQAGARFTINGCHLNEAGDREVSLLLDRALFGTTHPIQIDSTQFERIRSAVNDKSWVHLQDYRMLNGWYVYGGRRTWDTETFPLEYKKVRAMAATRDRYIWDLARQKPVPPAPDDSGTGELVVPPTRFGTPRQAYSEAPELRYLTPEEAIATMETPEGFEVQLFASEREFPELANPVQMAFDNKGRLWVACMPSYPLWRPGDPRPADRLLILEDTNNDGKADKCTVFYDQLHCPTGFEFWNGGVLVVDQPRILFLKDTTGDDKADQVVPWTDGWATDDTHHTVGAFEWSHGGLLHMLEGVAMATAVETPWGPFRNHGSPGAYVLDPRSLKLRRFVTPAYGNGWCYVFNWWGQGIVGDGTGANHHWDSPLSGAPFSGRRSLNPLFNNQGMRPAIGSEFLYSRHFPDDVQGQFIYAVVINMNGIPRFEIRDDGAGYSGNRVMSPQRDANGRQLPDDLLRSTDKNFRPADPQLGPDGALWFADWANALIGHMQYSQRDPNRDKQHGRVYRLVYKNKPLLTPVIQHGKSESELLDQLKIYETRTRYAARRELRDRPIDKVNAAIKTWVSKLDPQDQEYDRLLCEALWVQQSHHAVDPELLHKVLRAQTADARAIAVRIASDEQDFLPNTYALIKSMVRDDHPRVRLEAVRALSFHPTVDSVETALAVVEQPMDYWLDYTIHSTLGALRPVWEKPLQSGRIAQNNPAQLEFLSDFDLSLKPGGLASKHLRILMSEEAKPPEREKAYDDLAAMKGNANNGKAVFGRICIVCHKVGHEGIEYGPDMTDVGNRLNSRDLIESVLFPNAKVDPKYVTTNLETRDGDAYSGFITSETPGALTLRVAGGQEQTFQKSDLTHLETINVSSMPEGLAEAISPAEFLDLLEYMRSLK
jgi:putative heme-binding domain-containing protein